LATKETAKVNLLENDRRSQKQDRQVATLDQKAQPLVTGVKVGIHKKQLSAERSALATEKKRYEKKGQE